MFWSRQWDRAGKVSKSQGILANSQSNLIHISTDLNGWNQLNSNNPKQHRHGGSELGKEAGIPDPPSRLFLQGSDSDGRLLEREKSLSRCWENLRGRLCFQGGCCRTEYHSLFMKTGKTYCSNEFLFHFLLKISSTSFFHKQSPEGRVEQVLQARAGCPATYPTGTID